MLKHFVGEYILILTSSTMVVEGKEHAEEVPVVFEGVLIDYDDNYLMIGTSEDAPAELVNRDMVLRISQSIEQQEELPEGMILN